MASVVSSLLIGSYPDGYVERSWQRLALGFRGLHLSVRRWVCWLHLSRRCPPCHRNPCLQSIRTHLARLASRAAPLAGTEQFAVARSRRRAGHVRTLCGSGCHGVALGCDSYSLSSGSRSMPSLPWRLLGVFEDSALVVTMQTRGADDSHSGWRSSMGSCATGFLTWISSSASPVVYGSASLLIAAAYVQMLRPRQA